MSPYVCSEWPQELTLDIIQSESIVYAIDMEGQTGFYKITTGNKLETWNPNEGQEELSESDENIDHHSGCDISDHVSCNSSGYPYG